jgi:hypothetical protein
MTDPILIELTGLRLPRDFAWRKQFIAAVEAKRLRLGLPGRFVPPRFLGYYFCGRHPVVLAGRWRVTLKAAVPLGSLRRILQQITDHPFNLVAESEETMPEFLLVHDEYDGGCWLWGFEPGRRFVGALQPAGNPGECPAEGGDEDEGWSRPGL